MSRFLVNNFCTYCSNFERNPSKLFCFVCSINCVSISIDFFSMSFTDPDRCPLHLIRVSFLSGNGEVLRLYAHEFHCHRIPVSFWWMNIKALVKFPALCTYPPARNWNYPISVSPVVTKKILLVNFLQYCDGYLACKATFWKGRNSLKQSHDLQGRFLF